MDKMDKCSGNTKPRISQSKYWCFTDFDTNLDKWTTIFEKENFLYIIGKEKCPTTGKDHLQGYIESPKPIRPLEKFSKFKTVHWEKRKGTKEQNITYCSKEKNFISNFEINKKIKDETLNTDLSLQII